MDGLERRGMRLIGLTPEGAPRTVPPTPKSAEVATTHQADEDITGRKCSGGYVWLEGVF